MLKIYNQTIRVKCPKGHWIAVPTEDWDRLDPEINEKPDSAMGNVIHHCLELFDHSCPQCGAIFSANIDVWEYPMGAEELRELTDNINADDAAAAVTVEL